MRLAAKCEIEPEEHTSDDRLRRRRTGSRPATTACRPSRCSTRSSTPTPPDEELERLRILARTPRWGREIDDAILPAEAGLDERAVSFTKGCFPGQEPVARLHYRGHANRGAARARGRRRAPSRRRGRATRASRSAASRARAPTGVALAYVRVEAGGAEVEVGRQQARGYTDPPAPVAQGIERCPAEAEVAGSNLAGRIRGTSC